MLHTNDKIVKHKIGLLNLADELGNISKACTKSRRFRRDDGRIERYILSLQIGGE